MLPAVLAALYAWAVFATSFYSPGLIGPNYDAPGTDYMAIISGVQTALRGEFRLLMDPDRFTALLNATYRDRLSYPLTFRPWLYPPGLIVLLAPLAALPFFASYLVFELATAAAAATAFFRRNDARVTSIVIIAVLVSPAAASNMLWGQTGFLTLALLIGGVRWLNNRSLLAGAVLGLLSVKPQHAVLLPLVFVGSRDWRAALAAVASASLLAAMTASLFGIGIWRAWISQTWTNMSGAAPRWFSEGQVWDNSVHTCAMLLGATPRLATGLSVLAFAVAGYATYAVFRLNRAPWPRLAVLSAATMLAAPHVGPYDMLLPVLAAGLLLAQRRNSTSLMPWILGLLIWLLPLLGQPVLFWPARFEPLVSLLLVLLLVQQTPDALA